MHVRVAIPEHFVSPDTLEPALESTTRVNEHLIRSGAVPLATTAIASGVRWRPEPPGDESFDHGQLVWGRGWGDCDDLAPWHAASLRVTGEDPGARAIVVPSGPETWHALVERSDGRIEDPSLAAGMPGPGASAMPIERAMVNGGVYVGLRPSARGWQARIDVPVAQVGCASCSLSIIDGDDTPYTAMYRAAGQAAVVGQLGGAATTDVKKLQALAALADGISQRQLIDHVDPDLLLGAVLMDQTIERKLDEWHRQRGVVVGYQPHGHQTHAQFQRCPPGQEPVFLPGQADGVQRWACFPSLHHGGVLGALTKAQADAVARGFQHGMQKWWASPKGHRYKKGLAIAKKFREGQARYWASPEGQQASFGRNFQAGMAKYWKHHDAMQHAADMKLLKYPKDDQATIDASWRLLPADADKRAAAAARAFLVHMFVSAGGIPPTDQEPLIYTLFGTSPDVISTTDANNLQDLARQVGLANYWRTALGHALAKRGLPIQTNPQWQYFDGIFSGASAQLSTAWDSAMVTAKNAGNPGPGLGDITKALETVAKVVATAIISVL